MSDNGILPLQFLIVDGESMLMYMLGVVLFAPFTNLKLNENAKYDGSVCSK